MSFSPNIIALCEILLQLKRLEVAVFLNKLRMRCFFSIFITVILDADEQIITIIRLLHLQGIARAEGGGAVLLYVG